MTSLVCPNCGFNRSESQRCPDCRKEWLEAPAEKRLEKLVRMAKILHLHQPNRNIFGTLCLNIQASDELWDEWIELLGEPPRGVGCLLTELPRKDAPDA